MSKTKKSPIKKIQSIIDRFESSCKDMELTDRFNAFMRNDKIFVDRWNSELKVRENLIEELNKIESLIMSELEKEKLPSDLVIRRTEIRENLKSLDESLVKLKDDLEYNKFLIERYKVIQDKQLLLWYGILKDIEYFDGTWIEFKTKYGKIHL
jgi:hypothetical protein